MADLSGWAPAAIAVVTAIYTGGALVGRIKNQEITLKEHHDRLDNHDDRLSSLDVKAAESKAWREGYNVGKNHPRT